MTDLKTVMDAEKKIESGEPLEEKHLALIKPMFKILKEKLKPTEIPRFKHISGGYLIGPRFFSEQDGFEYIQRLLQQESVPSIVLWSRDSLGDSGVLTELTDADESLIDDTPHPSNPYQAAEPQKVFSVGMAQKMLARIDELNAGPANPERKRTVRFLEGELRRYRYKRDIKSFDDEIQRARRAVERAIKRAIDKLIDTPETRDIGLHLKETIKTGVVCEYTGLWEWEF